MNELALEDSNGTLIGVSRIRNDEKRGFFADDCEIHARHGGQYGGFNRHFTAV